MTDAIATAATGHEPARHWGLERTTSLAAFVLLVWLLVSLWRLPALDHATVTEWLRNPLAATPMLLFVVVTFRHLQMGLTVVVEDYVHTEGGKLGWRVLIDYAAILAAALAVICVLKIATSVPVAGI